MLLSDNLQVTVQLVEVLRFINQPERTLYSNVSLRIFNAELNQIQFDICA